MSGRSWIAVSLGLTVAAGMILALEVWQRSRELGVMEVLSEPPGLKYALSRTGPDPTLGWREDRVPPPRVAGRKRIVAVGDSVTYGVSVTAPEAWPAVLGNALDAEFFNFGVNGYDAGQVVALLEAHVADWQPDVVVWGTFVNDSMPTYLLYGAFSGDPVFVGEEVPSRAHIVDDRIARVLLRHSALFRRLQGAVQARVELGRTQVSEPRWYERQLDRAVEWSRARGIPIVFLALPPHVIAHMETCAQAFPTAGQCEADVELYENMVSALQARDVRWADGLAALRETGIESFQPVDHLDPDHPGPEGQAAYARAVEPIVREILFPFSP